MNAPTELVYSVSESFVRALDEEMGWKTSCSTARRTGWRTLGARIVLEAIGNPKLVNTADDARLSRICPEPAVIQTWTHLRLPRHGETLMSL